MPTWKRLLITWGFVPFHRFLLRVSRGRALGRLEGLGVLVLRTRGRRTGRWRSSPLLYFEFDDSGERIVVGSNYGQDHHPAWYLNLAADPDVRVEAHGERFAARARTTAGPEHAALFDKVIAANARFATYRASTDREIPIVALRPADGDPARGP